jgi:hypothetical protein
MATWPRHVLARFRSTVIIAGLFTACIGVTPLFAQEHRTVILGEIGGASIGHHDSLQGSAPIWGGSAGFFFTPHIGIEGAVQGARVSHVFGRDHHDFTELTMTGSLLFRAPARGGVHFLAGNGHTQGSTSRHLD